MSCLLFVGETKCLCISTIDKFLFESIIFFNLAFVVGFTGCLFLVQLLFQLQFFIVGKNYPAIAFWSDME